MKTSILFTVPFAALALACSGQSEPRTIATGASCSSLTDGDATLASLYKPGGVYSAEPIEEKVFRARAAQPELTMGAKLKVRAKPGMNAPYMQRVLACHAAGSNSAHPNDPLHPSQGTVASLTVERSKFGFEINVRGEDHHAGEEIWKRADAMSNQAGAVDVEQVASGPKSGSQF